MDYPPESRLGDTGQDEFGYGIFRVYESPAEPDVRKALAPKPMEGAMRRLVFDPEEFEDLRPAQEAGQICLTHLLNPSDVITVRLCRVRAIRLFVHPEFNHGVIGVKHILKFSFRSCVLHLFERMKKGPASPGPSRR